MSIEAAKLFVTVGSNTTQGEAGLNSFDDKLENVAQKATMTGGILTASITAPLVLLGTQALTSAANFEQSMNVTQQVVGATNDQMAALSAQALDLGAKTVFSAGEAAQGMLELGKSGMSATDIMQAIPGVMDLAAAGQVSLANAADITAASLNAFHLKADQAGQVANILAAAANASAADISDLAQGVGQGGFAFSAMGEHIDDLAASLAILTNVGLTGSDAGTALKNTMIQMMHPTQQAQDAMQQLGLMTQDTGAAMDFLRSKGVNTGDDLQAAFAQFAGFKDKLGTVGGFIPVSVSFKEDPKFQQAYQQFLSGFGQNKLIDQTTGQFKSWADIIGILNESLSGLTAAQRNQALATMFGSDGMKALIPLLAAGEDGFLRMKDSVNQQGAAADVANANMKGLSGAVKYFKGSVDSFMITTALPYLGVLGNMVRGAADLLTGFGQMSASTRNAGLAFLGVLAAAGPVLLVVGALAAGLAFLLSPIGLVVAGTAALAAAWAGDFGGIQEITTSVFDSVVATLTGWWGVAQPYFDAAIATAQVLWTGLTGQGSVEQVLGNLDIISAAFGPGFADAVSSAGLALGGFVASTKNTIDAVRPYFSELLGWIDSAQKGDWGPLKNGLEGWGKQIQLTVSSFAWDSYVKALDWGTYVIALPWNSYISILNWSAYVTVLGWSSYLTTLAWDTYIDSLTWGPWISHLLWDTYVSVLAWSPWLSNLVWDVYIDSLNWGSWITAITWNAYIVSLNWRDFLLSPNWDTWLDPVTWETYIPNLVWSTYLSAISWGNYVGLLLWNTYVSALSWGDYVSHLNWGDYLPHFTWGSVATKSLDWGAYITLLPWGNYVQQLVWNRAISDIVWTKYIAPIDWGTFLPKLAAWSYIVNPVNWNGFIGALVWETVLGKIDWKQFVSNFTDWSTAATPILWSDFVTYLHWDAFLYGIRWDQFVPVLEWPKAIFDFDWGRFIPDFLKGMFGFGGNDKSTSSSFPSLKSLASPQMAGPNDILAQGQREQAMSLGQTFGAAGLDALMTGLHWPQFPGLEDLGFHWPAIPIPDWWNDLLKATGLAQSSAASALDIYDNIVAVADRISNNNGGGGSTGGDNGGGVVVDPNQPNFPAAAAFAAAGNGGDVIYIDFGGVTISTPIDLEAFKLDIINTIRRRS